MKNIAIMCNHTYPHIGGCEIVIKNIAERLISKFDYHIDVYSGSLIQPRIVYNGVNYIAIDKNFNTMLKILYKNNYDNIFVYSDVFRQLLPLIGLSHKFNRLTIATVGANFLSANLSVLELIKARADKIRLISHSEINDDAKLFQKHAIPYDIIPNGVNLDEFKNVDFSFREKFGINKYKKILLCVSNFFPGKGQDTLIESLDKLSHKYKDFVAVFIFSTVNFAPANQIEARCRSMLKKKNFDSLLLKNLPRKDVVAAFNESDLFLTQTQKEVSPLMILEAVASSTPWVAFNTGNISEMPGGIILNAKRCFNGYLRYDAHDLDKYANAVYKILMNDDISNLLIKDGSRKISEYSWDSIVDMYNNIFDR